MGIFEVLTVRDDGTHSLFKFNSKEACNAKINQCKLDPHIKSIGWREKISEKKYSPLYSVNI